MPFWGTPYLENERMKSVGVNIPYLNLDSIFAISSFFISTSQHQNRNDELLSNFFLDKKSTEIETNITIFKNEGKIHEKIRVSESVILQNK
jgi:hypothetical protein